MLSISAGVSAKSISFRLTYEVDISAIWMNLFLLSMEIMMIPSIRALFGTKPWFGFLLGTILNSASQPEANDMRLRTFSLVQKGRGGLSQAIGFQDHTYVVGLESSAQMEQ
jgi:hypothetical protein